MSGLFTVLIAEKEHIDAIQKENKLFFEPFLENKELAFCSWNPEGQSLYDSAPWGSNNKMLVLCFPETVRKTVCFPVVWHQYVLFQLLKL